jgi:hypothetical protein
MSRDSHTREFGMVEALSGRANRGNPARFPAMRWQFNPDGRAPIQ